MSSIEFTILMPCLNEFETIEKCIVKAKRGLIEAGVQEFEILISDNGSTDNSVEIAKKNGARVVETETAGYGAALTNGIRNAKGKYVIMGDADDSYDWSNLSEFVFKLRQGYDLVMGSRLNGKILPGAMPFLHQFLGNPILTAMGNFLFRAGVSDFHCGLRGFDREKIEELDLNTVGMEFATEMVAKAAVHKLEITEVPITYFPDGRTRSPHLRTWQDGWRHFSFMLLLSPNWVFLLPGFVLIALSVFGILILLPGTVYIGNVGLDIHTLLIASTLLVLGIQILIFWLVSQTFAGNNSILPFNKFVKRINYGNPLFIGITTGSILFLFGLLLIFQVLKDWSLDGFHGLDLNITLRWVVPGLTLISIGSNVFFATFVMAIINFKEYWTTN